jgi:two-component system nitrate/nitrite response regulator NarL
VARTAAFQMVTPAAASNGIRLSLSGEHLPRSAHVRHQKFSRTFPVRRHGIGVANNSTAHAEGMHRSQACLDLCGAKLSGELLFQEKVFGSSAPRTQEVAAMSRLNNERVKGEEAVTTKVRRQRRQSRRSASLASDLLAQLVRRRRSVADFAVTKRRRWKRQHKPSDAKPVRRSIRVVIADGNPIFLHGLRCLLEAESDFAIVAACQNATACIAAMRVEAPDLAVLETCLPGGGGTQVLETIATEGLHVRPVLLSSDTDMNEGARALAMGACGVVSRGLAPQSLIWRLRQVASGQRLLLVASCGSQVADDPETSLVALTPREQQIIALVSTGLSNRQVGSCLEIREGTVKAHLNHVFQKLAIRQRTSLVSLWHSRFPRSRPSQR